MWEGKKKELEGEKYKKGNKTRAAAAERRLGSLLGSGKVM